MFLIMTNIHSRFWIFDFVWNNACPARVSAFLSGSLSESIGMADAWIRRQLQAIEFKECLLQTTRIIGRLGPLLIRNPPPVINGRGLELTHERL